MVTSQKLEILSLKALFIIVGLWVGISKVNYSVMWCSIPRNVYGLFGNFKKLPKFFLDYIKTFSAKMIVMK